MRDRSSTHEHSSPSRRGSRRRSLLRGWVFCAALCLTTPSQGSPDEPYTIGSTPAWFFLAGPTGGLTMTFPEYGFFAGGEVSVARARGRVLLGGYIDGFYDFGFESWILTAGPELGLVHRSRNFPLTFGIDGGVAFQEKHWGGAVRLFVTALGVASLYARGLYFDSEHNTRALQLGLMFKFPLLVSNAGSAH